MTNTLDNGFFLVVYNLELIDIANLEPEGSAKRKYLEH